MLRLGAVSFMVLILGTLVSDFIQATGCEVSRRLVLRGIAVVCCLAFHSIYIQILTLIGENGLIPITSTMIKLKEFIGRPNITLSSEPIKFFMRHLLGLVVQKFQSKGDVNAKLVRECRIDLALSCVAVVYPHPILFAYLYFSYFAYKRVMDRFLSYQWDALLLESLLISIVLSLSFDWFTSTFAVWQVKLLLFRLMFGSGVVKYFGRDPSWHTSFTAMSHHFLTQPLPSMLGMHIHTRSPSWVFKAMTLGTLVVELLLPLLSLLNLTHVNAMVGLSYIGLQMSIGLSGYYGFFGTLTSVLSLSLLNDAFLRTSGQYLGLVGLSLSPPEARVPTILALLSTALSAVLIYPLLLVVTVVQLTAVTALMQYIPFLSAKSSAAKDGQKSPQAKGEEEEEDEEPDKTRPGVNLKVVQERLSQFHHGCMVVLFLGCHYGLFASMTKVRNEITVSVSADKQVWTELDLAYKPGSEYSPPKTISPFYHMPRLDWSLWFLPFTANKAAYPRWFWVLLVSLLEGNEDVLRALRMPSHKLSSMSIKGGSGEQRRLVVDGTPVQYLRVQLINYDYSRPSTDSSAVEGEGKRYWERKVVREVQGASSVEDLYEFLDALDKAAYGGDQSSRPRPESAQDIIARTLLRMRAAKKAGKSE